MWSNTLQGVTWKHSEKKKQVDSKTVSYKVKKAATKYNPYPKLPVLRFLGFIYLFILFYFILFATLITKNIGKEEKKKEVARRPNRNYRSLWEVRPPRTMS